MPVLVSHEQGVRQPPIIGYNVMQQLVTKGMEQHPDVVPEVVKEVKVGRITTVAAAGQTKMVKCNVRTGLLVAKQEVLFEPEDIPQ